MQSNRPFKLFQIRWREPLGRPDCPYLYRWMFIFFGFSIRIHHWLRSDDNRHFHDHSCNLISMCLRGTYFNVVPLDPDVPDVQKSRKIRVSPFRPWFARATDKHYLEIPAGGAWTILLQGRPYHKWGFYVRKKRNERVLDQWKKWRPLQYFSKYGIVQDEHYQ